MKPEARFAALGGGPRLHEPARAERESLSAEQIVREAIALLDAAGIDGLSMRRLGNRLGTTGAAIYWHVKGRHDLVLLAADAVWREIELPHPGASGWRPIVMTMAADMHSMFVQHPWLMAAMAVHGPHGPGRARYEEHLVAVCEGGGLTRQDAERSTEIIMAFVLGAAISVTDSDRFSLGLRAILDGMEPGLTPCSCRTG